MNVDKYIDKREAFARPVLEHLRGLVHDACPQVTETLKWGFPHFMYKNRILCSMASFKAHCAFGFWLASEMSDPAQLFITEGDEKAMGQLGQIKSIKDLPPDKIIIAYLEEAMSLIDRGVKPANRRPSEKKEIIIPDDVKAVLKKNKAAGATFEKLSYSHQKEYVEWIVQAKQEATRLKRLNTMEEWLSEGKNMNWRYEQKSSGS